MTEITTVVFDLGNVLIGWDPRRAWAPTRSEDEIEEFLEESGFAPPQPRAATGPTLVQLDAQAFRCPYCGSTDTGLENIFGPTPCRSIRYCRDCRQPFEQFKTI